MEGRPRRLDPRTPRELFAAWVEDALDEVPPRPSPLAGAYLVDLLAGRVRTPPPDPDPRADATLAEAYLGARQLSGGRRLRRLRAVGDRALFVAGFFGDSLLRRPVGIPYYRDVGSAAYRDLSSQLSQVGAAPAAGPAGPDGPDASEGWGPLYRELAHRFADLIEVLGAVADRSRAARERDVLALYERWLATGSESLRRRLARLGCVAGERRRTWQ